MELGSQRTKGKKGNGLTGKTKQTSRGQEDRGHDRTAENTIGYVDNGLEENRQVDKGQENEGQWTKDKTRDGRTKDKEQEGKGQEVKG